MAQRLSRRKIAAYAADKLLAGEKPARVTKELAAYLQATGRTREQELLVRDIEGVLSERGVTVASVTSAHPLSQQVKKELAALVGKGSLQLRETVDPSVLGGVRLDIPGKRFDGTLKRKLGLLKEAKQG